jgi:ABC-2 type transport system ATP-binding protein
MALIVRNLRKTYGLQVALNGVDLTLSGGVVALLGANGSGKSTLLRILATLSKPDAGDITFDGWSYAQRERQLRAQIGYLPQDLELPDTLTPRKLLSYLANLRGGHAGDVLATLQLEAVANQPFRKLSGGQLRRVGIAQALLGSPRLLLLDELARGLDALERARVFRLVSQCGKLVIFSTHIPEEAESIAETIIVLHQGGVLFCGALAEMRALAEGRVYELRVPVDALPRMTASLLVSRVVTSEDTALLRVIGKPVGIEATAVAPSLEDAYLLLTGRVQTSTGIIR